MEWRVRDYGGLLGCLIGCKTGIVMKLGKSRKGTGFGVGGM